MRCFVLTLLFVLASLSAHAASFQGLGDLPGGAALSFASDISAEGTVVVGTSVSASGAEAFRWTRDDGIVGLGYLAGGLLRSQASGVSADGSVIVGFGHSASGR